MYIVLVSAALVAAAGSQAQAEPDSAPPKDPEIVVEAPQVTGDALAACLSQSCPPIQDVRATIRHAQAQFATGMYADARSTLWASIKRNRSVETTQPRAVSALYHALARVTLHNGDKDEFRRSALRAASILADSRIIEPHERVNGQIRLADAYAALGELNMARAAYRTARSMAEAAGLKSAADVLRVREVWMGVLSGLDNNANQRLAAMATDQSLAIEARGSAAKLAGGAMKPGDADYAKMLDVLSKSPQDTTVLLWSAPTASFEERDAENANTAFGDLWPAPARARGGELRGLRWADIGYWVRPDGSVDGARVIAGPGNRAWAAKLIGMFNDRQYTPFTPEPGSEGTYRVERVTLTYDWKVPVNSNIRRRVGLPSYRFERLSESPFVSRDD